MPGPEVAPHYRPLRQQFLLAGVEDVPEERHEVTARQEGEGPPRRQLYLPQSRLERRYQSRRQMALYSGRLEQSQNIPLSASCIFQELYKLEFC